MKLSKKLRSKLILFFICLIGLIYVYHIIDGTISMINFFKNNPSSNVVEVFMEILSEFTWEILTIAVGLFYLKIFFDQLINAYVKSKNYSLSQLINQGNFKKKYFKVKNNEIITRFYIQRKVIHFLKRV